MRIECVKEKLSQAVAKVEKMTGKNLNLQVLSCIYIKTEKNAILLRATNLDMGIEVEVPAKIHSEGSVAVPGATLSAFLTSIKNEKNITLELIDGNLSIKTGSLSTLIKSQSAEDFPSLPRVPKEKGMRINPKLFVKGLKSVWYAASNSLVKPELSSVYVHPVEDSLVFVSTDSFRLAEKRIKHKEAKDFPSLIIPSKNIADIIKTIEDLEEDIDVLFDKTQIAFVGTNIYLVSRVIDGTFPDYTQIIPKSQSTEVVALKEDVIDAIKSSNIFSDKLNQLNVKVAPADKLFQIKTRNNDVGEYVRKIDASVTGEALDINFNHRYIADCFQSIDSDSILLSFNGATKPLVIKSVSDKSFLYLVMPMNK